MLTLRNNRNPKELDDLSSRITSRLLALREVQVADVICPYLHFGSEVRTLDIVNSILSLRKRVIVPITDPSNRRLIFSELFSLTDLHPGVFGVPEPEGQFVRCVPLENADVILVPGIAWDSQGYRLGYGGGYYDRSLNLLRKPVLKVGLSYEFQILKRVPRSRHDRCVDRLVTESEVINTGPIH